MPAKRQVLIVGAGPAGLLAAQELAKHGLGITIIEEGEDVRNRNCPMLKLGYCTHCRLCHFVHGVGGGGAFSDGKLNLNPEIGGNMLEFTTPEHADELLHRVEHFFLKYAGNSEEEGTKDHRVAELERSAKSAGIKFIPIRQRHLGSDRLPKIIERMVADLKKAGVKLLVRTKAEEILVKGGKVKGVVARDLTAKKPLTLKADYVILATGRGGARWMAETCRKLKLDTKFQPLDVGVRVEVPHEIMDAVTKVNWDPKFHIRTKRYDDFVRTFCTNPMGFVITESYEDFICVNGHSMRGKKSENSNFALLVQVALTQPVENTTEYGEGIAKLATIIGGGKPTLQRLGDLRAGRRSTWERIDRSYVSPTLREATPGDISMALPGRIVLDIIEGLDALNKVIPGVAEDETLLYAPEIKFHALRVSVSNLMETKTANLFAAGDGAGVSRGIVGAGVTGLIAADEIIKREKHGR